MICGRVRGKVRNVECRVRGWGGGGGGGCWVGGGGGGGGGGGISWAGWGLAGWENEARFGWKQAGGIGVVDVGSVRGRIVLIYLTIYQADLLRPDAVGD